MLSGLIREVQPRISRSVLPHLRRSGEPRCGGCEQLRRLWTAPPSVAASRYDSAMHLDALDEWLDNFDSWDEIWDLLHDDWEWIDDVRQGFRVEQEANGLLVVEANHRFRARDRRGLHRLGFRATSSGPVTLWRWDIETELRQMDLSVFAGPLERIFDTFDPAFRQRKIDQMRTRLATAHLMTERTQQVLRDVFRSQLSDVAVLLVREDDSWDDDEEWPLPTI